ncbi:transcription termination factor, mitochondrial [Cataglyphis hispanica]|uniref:transcription termination factor, mitochondrial n=1 Tax=Cataglyphis hispanica TaxID=1086592 RepID=UPI00217FC977|nr:transcription termination factor, mitochondrial [Cataglyphis hispanica]XP_050453823.1 transcription termination factor, mitochondrial [Cataglyphis hispanica]
MARSIVQRVIINLLLKRQPQLQLLKFAVPLHLKEHSQVRFISQSRLLCKDVDLLVDHTCEISNYNMYIINYTPIIRIMIQTLNEILDTTTTETNKIIADNPQLKKRTRANVLNNYYNLIDAGVQKSTIVKNAWLLAHENDKLKNKLDCIKVLNMNNDLLIPWLRLTQEELANYVFYTQNDMGSYTHNKIEHLAHRLECSIEKLCELTVRYTFLLKIPISYIDKKLNILHEYNINNKDILKDLWVFRYSENHIRHRCELYKDTGTLEIKTWAIRCQLRFIARAIQNNNVKRCIMRNHSSVSEFLMYKLKIDEERLNLAIAKSPGILRINLLKLNWLINILHENGITSDDILQDTRIFYFNIQTVQKRIERLKKEHIVPKLPVLALAEQSFERRIKKNHLQREILQDHQDVKEYLIDKLNVDEKLLEEAIAKLPILRINVRKLNQLIDLLQQYGIMGDEILRHPRVLFFKTETLRKKIERLKEVGLPLKVTLLIYSQKDFDEYINHKILKYERFEKY